MTTCLRLALAALAACLFIGPVRAQIAVYDTATGLVQIPSVAVGGSVYTQVILRDNGQGSFVLQAATLESPTATPPFASYDLATSVLTLPVVNVGTVNYRDVTLRNVGDFVFTVLGGTPGVAPPRIEAPPRWLPVWTSTSADTRLGSYTLSVVDPAAPGTLLPVSTAVPLADFQSLVLHVRGGSYDPASGQVLDPGERHLVLNIGHKIFKVSYDHVGTAAPTPVQLSSETTADGQPLLLAQSASGDDALVQVQVRGLRRYVRLSTPATSAALVDPVFPGDFATLAFAGSTVDPDSGALTSLLWTSLTPNSSYRLFRTGPDLQAPVSIATYSGSIDRVAPFAHQRMARGWMFRADGALRRYDAATRSVGVVQDGVDALIGGALHDDDSVLLRAQVAGQARLLRCVDAAGARCVTLLSGSAVGTTANAFLLQTRNYVQLYPVSGTLVTSVRKADGASVQIDIPTGGFVRLWSYFGSAGQAAGDRLFYWRNNGSRNLVGSVLADGSDRKEFDGTPISTVWTLPQRLAPHRLGNLDGVAPIDKLLVRAGVAGNPLGNGSDRLAWLDGSTGDLSADLGSIPSKYFNVAVSFAAAPPPYTLSIGSIGTIGLLADVRQANLSSVKSLDAFMLRTQPPGIVRLSNLIP